MARLDAEALGLGLTVFVLLRGHNLPGGGFIAGLITAVALITQYLANGIAWTHSRMGARPSPMIGLGLLIATTTGLGSWLFDRPFLTSAFTHVHWPLVGEFEIASAMLFDLGVYLAVVGTVLIILAGIGRLDRAPRRQEPFHRQGAVEYGGRAEGCRHRLHPGPGTVHGPADHRRQRPAAVRPGLSHCHGGVAHVAAH